MFDHQRRVLDEHRELEVKIEKLSAFLTSSTFALVDVAEQRRLTLQKHLMVSYSIVLQQRIAAFTK